MGRSFPRRAALAFPIIGRRLSLIWISMLRKLRPFLILFFPLETSFETRGWMRMSTTKPSFEHGSPRQPGLVSFSDALKELSNTVLSLNLHLSVFYIPSRENPADHPSRRFSPADSNLARHLWLRLQSHPCFGGSDGHSVDLMALESNAQSDGGGVILPHFTPYPTPLSSGVDFFG